MQNNSVFLFYERGGDSPSLHKQLPYLRSKPCKRFSLVRRRRSQKTFAEPGLLRSAERLDAVPQSVALHPCACASRHTHCVVLKNREGGRIKKNISIRCKGASPMFCRRAPKTRNFWNIKRGSRGIGHDLHKEDIIERCNRRPY